MERARVYLFLLDGDLFTYLYIILVRWNVQNVKPSRTIVNGTMENVRINGNLILHNVWREIRKIVTLRGL